MLYIHIFFLPQIHRFTDFSFFITDEFLLNFLSVNLWHFYFFPEIHRLFLFFATDSQIFLFFITDTFALKYQGSIDVSLLATGIAWTTDRNIKFQNPQNFNNTARPKNWQTDVADLGTKADGNYGYQNEDLIVWMRTAALPTFRKFYRRVDHSKATFTQNLPSGNYTMTIQYSKIVFFI